MDTIKEKILEALEEAHGIVSLACSNASVPRSTYYKWLNSDEEFKKAVEEIQDVALDHVESKLFEKIQGVSIKKGEDIYYETPPSDTAIIFYLKTKGKKRGYIERTEVTGADGKPMQTETKHVVEFHNYGSNSTAEVQRTIYPDILN